VTGLLNRLVELRQRLRVIAAFAKKSLCDTIAAFCSWIVIEKKAKPNTAEIFFDSGALTDLLQSVLWHRQRWSEMVRMQLSNFFSELFGSDITENVILSFDGLMANLTRGSVDMTDFDIQRLASVLDHSLHALHQAQRGISNAELRARFVNFEVITNSFHPKLMLESEQNPKEVLDRLHTLYTEASYIVQVGYSLYLMDLLVGINSLS
jgi:hypothetical protein